MNGRSTLHPHSADAAGPAAPGVLLVTSWYGRTGNGVALVVESLAQSMHRAGVRVVVLELLSDGWQPRLRYGTAGEPILSLCVRNVEAARSTPRRLAAQLRAAVASVVVRRIVRRYDLQVAHFHYAFAEYSAVRRVVQRQGLPIVCTFHGNDLGINMDDPPTRAATEDLVRGAAVVTTVSDALGHRLVTHFPFAARLGRTIHNPIPANFADYASGPHGSERDIDILFVGNLIGRKGVDVLLGALPSVREQEHSLRVVIAGDGPDRAHLEALAASLRLDEVVTFVGQQDRRATVRLFRRARIAVAPSRAEPFGLVVVEALAAGARVVASGVGGIPEIASETGGIVLVPPGDSDALARALVAVLDDPAGDAIATAARERALVTFAPHAISAAYVDAYRAALGMDCASTAG